MAADQVTATPVLHLLHTAPYHKRSSTHEVVHGFHLHIQESADKSGNFPPDRRVEDYFATRLNKGEVGVTVVSGAGRDVVTCIFEAQRVGKSVN